MSTIGEGAVALVAAVVPTFLLTLEDIKALELALKLTFHARPLSLRGGRCVVADDDDTIRSPGFLS
jgi:hypothetical protein